MAKVIGILVVILVYAVSPVDLIPDILPLIGTLDDSTVAILGGYFIKD